MKLEEGEGFLVLWKEGHLDLKGVSETMTLLKAAPGPIEVVARTHVYLAFDRVPDQWLSLFDKALEGPPTEVSLEYKEKLDEDLITTTYLLTPCELGEHMHAQIIVSYSVVAPDGKTLDGVESAELIYRAWQTVGSRIEGLKGIWIHPFLEAALDIEQLHGGLSA